MPSIYCNHPKLVVEVSSVLLIVQVISFMNDNIKVVVTGGYGFIGTAVLEQLLRFKAKILVIDKLITELKVQRSSNNEIQLIEQDINNVNFENIEPWKGAFWIHLAALPFIPVSFKNPEKVFLANTIGTLSACKLATLTNAKKFIHISSCEVYKSTNNNKTLSEDSPLGPLSPYANSKLAAELVVKAELKSMPYTILRLFNSYGPRPTHPYFIPEMIKQCLFNERINVGNINTFRDFTFVKDTAMAIILTMLKANSNYKIINIGSGYKYEIKEILKSIQKLTNSEKKSVVIEPLKKRDNALDPISFVANNSKAKKILDWEPKVNLMDGLKKTIDYFYDFKGSNE